MSVLGLDLGYTVKYKPCLQDFPRALPSGTPSGKGLYLTVNPLSCPNTDREHMLILYSQSTLVPISLQADRTIALLLKSVVTALLTRCINRGPLGPLVGSDPARSRTGVLD